MDVGNMGSFNALRPVKQYFEWGTVKWLEEPEDLEKGRLLVGHVTFLPHKRQDQHLHTGDEQILYIISGTGEQWVDGHFYPLVPGMVYHISPYAKHELRNTGDDVLEMIIVYNPTSSNGNNILPSTEFTKEYTENYTVENLNDIIDIPALQEIQDKYSNAASLAIVIQDRDGNNITQISNMLKFCRKRCEHGYSCKFKNRYVTDSIKEATVTSCCYDAVCIAAPIYFGQQYIGTILCGPVFLNEPTEEALAAIRNEEKICGIDGLKNSYLDIRKITKGRLYAIIESLKTINTYIVQTGIDNLAHNELHAKTLQVLKEIQTRNQLEKALSEAKMKAIQAQMSPHFLFNTLSVIGELAYMKGAKEAAETTFALSSLLRKSLRKSQELVFLKEELEYIQDYIFIQQKRFRNLVNTEVEVDERIIETKIPFMTLQIPVENAIIHGLHPLEKQGVLSIAGSLQDNRIILQVTDNGVGIRPERLKDILKGNNRVSTRGIGLGLSNLKERLDYYFGDAYTLDISSSSGEGTTVTITLPFTNGRGDDIDKTAGGR
ncbi:MAG: Two-component system sensor histidine kinase [Firmicutes bacterium]|nr:Two-component system sensor histidine kinase [Bacillota bacterium]MDI6704808.1 PocR ligand-binding domain-containing protein [Bacillota bacterium]